MRTAEAFDFAALVPPEVAARHARQPVDDRVAALLARFRAAVALWERWFLDHPQEVVTYERDLEWTLHDLRACASCDGQGCRAILNARQRVRLTDRGPEAYWEYPLAGQGHDPNRAFWYGPAPAPYGPPRFAFHRCPGPSERRAQVLALYRRLQRLAQLADPILDDERGASH